MLDPGFMSQSLTSFHHFHLRWRLPLFFTAFIQRICSHDTCTIADKTLRQSTCFFCHCSFKNKTALFACPSGTWQHIYAWLWIFYFWKKWPSGSRVHHQGLFNHFPRRWRDVFQSVSLLSSSQNLEINRYILVWGASADISQKHRSCWIYRPGWAQGHILIYINALSLSIVLIWDLS